MDTQTRPGAHPSWCGRTDCYITDDGTPDETTTHVLNLPTLTLAAWSGADVDGLREGLPTWSQMDNEDGALLASLDQLAADVERARAWLREVND